MKQIITEKLWNYIVQNNPDLMIILREEQSVFKYLENKVLTVLPMIADLQKQATPDYLIQEVCMEELTRELRPSKFHYIREIMEAEFEDSFSVMIETGVSTFEIINLMMTCRDIFENFNFSEESEDDRFLRYAVIGEVSAYLTNLE